MVQVKIRRPCSEVPGLTGPCYGGGIEGVECCECSAFTYKRDRKISHELVEEWVYLDELAEMINKVSAQ